MLRTDSHILVIVQTMNTIMCSIIGGDNMQWFMSLFRGRNNRNTIGRRGTMIMSVLALAIGATAIGVRRGRQGRLFQRML